MAVLVADLRYHPIGNHRIFRSARKGDIGRVTGVVKTQHVVGRGQALHYRPATPGPRIALVISASQQPSKLLGNGSFGPAAATDGAALGTEGISREFEPGFCMEARLVPDPPGESGSSKLTMSMTRQQSRKTPITVKDMPRPSRPMNGEPQGGLRGGNLLGEETGYPPLLIGYITQSGKDGQNQNQPEMSHDARLA